jgi:uncharacterized protein YjaG (DUF416 family)
MRSSDNTLTWLDRKIVDFFEWWHTRRPLPAVPGKTVSRHIAPFKNDIEQLSDRARLVFMVMICERLLPNFARFEADEGMTGRTASLRAAVDLIWTTATEGQLADREKARTLIQECELLAPDADETTSELWTSAAIDAAVAVWTTLEAVEDTPANDKALEVATCATDSVDMYIQLTDLDDRVCIGPKEEQ